MRIAPLASTPNQSFTVTLDNVRWGIGVKTGTGVTTCDIYRNGEIILLGARALAGEPLIPYAYLQNGNFIFTVGGGDLPTYLEFGVSQFLVYLSPDEVQDLSATPLNVGDLSSFQPTFLTSDDGFYLTTDTGEILTDD